MKGLLAGAALTPLLLTVPVALLAAGQPEVAPSAAVADIPLAMLELYQAAAPACPGLAWPVLAAVGKVETDHGRNIAVSSAGAVGPMQFLPATFAAYAVDGDRDGDTDIDDPADAVFTAAKYLCTNGAGQPERLAVALYNYNRAPAYVARVLSWALVYGAPTLTPATTAEQSRALLANPRLTLGAYPRADLSAGIIDGRVIALLTLLLERHTLAVSALRSGHSMCIGGGDPTTRPGCTISLHYYGRAVDIYSIDGSPSPPAAPPPGPSSTSSRLSHRRSRRPRSAPRSTWHSPGSSPTATTSITSTSDTAPTPGEGRIWFNGGERAARRRRRSGCPVPC